MITTLGYQLNLRRDLVGPTAVFPSKESLKKKKRGKKKKKTSVSSIPGWPQTHEVANGDFEL